jgi:hypothetical protein
VRALALPFLLSVCLIGPDAFGTEPNAPLEAERGRGAVFDWESQSPLDLLEFLETTTQLTVSEARPGWVKREHVPALIALLDSDKPCGSVALSVSSYIGGKSTIGNEAAYLILGYQRGVYPPELNSNLNPVDRARIREWWSSIEEKP